MAMYIHGMGTISPQQSWSVEDLLSSPLKYSGSRMVAVEPDYSNFIDPKAIRRMSRIIKMGVASASLALKSANVPVPDGIITGTGYGCLDDTGLFLTKMIGNNEEALNPTPFIQSTHNTIGSQVALLLQCQGYNQTYTQRGHSFENSLLDAMLQCDESSGNILVGAIDEITDHSHDILSRFGLFKNCENSLDLFADGNGTINGEGSSFFLVSGSRHSSEVQITTVNTFFKPSESQLETALKNLKADTEIDFVLSGKSGDSAKDGLLDKLIGESFPDLGVGYFKHLCGEFPVASGFAIWLGVKILESGMIPPVVGPANKRPLRNVLIFNHYLGKYFSMILLSR